MVVSKKSAVVVPAEEEVKVTSLYDEVARVSANTDWMALAQMKAKLGLEQLLYTASRSLEGADTLQINDLIFSMPRVTTPPVAIRIDKKILNYKWHTLRTSGSQKRSSGHSSITISFSLYFVGQEAINQGLRRLLVSFESTPFVYIENSFIRTNIIGSTKSDVIANSMACSLLSMNVHTVPQLPDVLVADVTLLWFNYKPFSPHFLFREKWGEDVSPLQQLNPPEPERQRYYTGELDAQGNPLMKERMKPGKRANVKDITNRGTNASETAAGTKKVADVDKVITDWSPPVRFPEHSRPLKDRLDRKMGDFAPLTKGLDNGMLFTYKEYRTLSSAEQASALAELQKTGVMRPLELQYFQQGGIVSGTVDLRLQAEAADKLEEMVRKIEEILF